MMKNLTKVLSVSMLGLLAITSSCKKDKNSTGNQTSLLHNKWYTKSFTSTSTNTTTGAVTTKNTNTDFTTSDYIIYDQSGAYTSVGSPFDGDNGKYSISTSNVLTMTSLKSNTTTNYKILQLDNSTLKIESTVTANNIKIVEDITFAK